MTTKKGVTPLLLVAGIIIVALVLIPGLGISVIAILAGQPEPCSATPYDSNCDCDEGFVRVSLDEVQSSFAETGLFFCESTDLIIDPENDPEWQTKALRYCQGRIQDEFPDCNINLDCNQENNQLITDWSFQTKDDQVIRRAVVECRELIDPTTAMEKFRCWFDIEDGEIYQVGSMRFLTCNP